MKNNFFKSIVAMMVGAFFCIVLTGCENFLSGADTKKQLDQLVKEANAPKVDVYLTAEKDSGELSPNGIYTCKVNQSFSILFIPANGYEFIKWEVLDRKTGVELTDAVSFEDINNPETKVTIVKNVNNIQIIPVCATLPFVVSTSPAFEDSGVFANMPIEIKFNMPMVNDDETVFPFSFDTISIYCDAEKINKYFYDPVLINENKTVKIVPKAKELQEFIESKRVRSIIVQVKVDGSKISLIKNGYECKFFETEASDFTYKMLWQIETEPPLISDCFISKKEMSLEDYTSVPVSKKISEEPNEGSGTEFNSLEIVKKHWVGKYLYIYGKFHDTGSGVKTIVVTESYLNDKNGNPIGGELKTFYEKENLQIIKDDNLTLEFIVRHELKSLDGCIDVNISSIDFCENPGETIKYRVIKDTDLNTENIYIYNLNYKYQPNINKAVFDVDLDELDNELAHVKIYIKSDLSTFGPGAQVEGSGWYYDCHNRPEFTGKQIYKTYKYLPEDYTVECEYLSKNGLVTEAFSIEEETETNTKYWGLRLNVDTVASLKLNVIVRDEVGNVEVLPCQFPGYVDKVKKIEAYGSDLKVYFDSKTLWTGARTFTTDNTNCPSDCNSSADYFYTTSGAMAKNSYFLHRAGFNWDIMLYNSVLNTSMGEGTNYFYLTGPRHTVNISDSITYNNTTDNTILPVPKACSYKKAAVNSSHVFITLEFDDSVWNYWDEITFNASGTGHDSGALQTVTKGTKFYTYEDEHCYNYCQSSQYSTSFKGYKLDSVVTSNGLITEMNTISGAGTYKFPKMPLEYFTEPVKLDVFNHFLPRAQFYYSETQAAGATWFYPPAFDQQYYFSPVLVTLKNDTVGIKKVSYQKADGVLHTNNYNIQYSNNRKPSDTTRWATQGLFFIPIDGLFDLGGLTVTVEDENGNYSTISVPEPVYIPYITKITDSTMEYSGAVTSNDFIYMLAFENGEWTVIYDGENGHTLRQDLVDADKISGLPQKKYLRVFLARGSSTGSTGSSSKPYKYDYSRSTYFYRLGDSSCNLYDMRDDNRGVQVKSDAPVFVHTLITQVPLEVCESWNIDKWETFHKVVNEQVISFEPTDCNWKKYNIDTSEMEPGDNYVVIAHFADGHTDMSALRQYNP